MKKPYCYEYPRPCVTVDLVVVTREENPRVLLIRRKLEPFAGAWAIPGGFINMDESLDDAARRELREETGVTVGKIHQLHTYGAPDRDPRARVISVAYLAQVDPGKLKPRADDDAADVAWHSLSRPPALAFDHREILKDARQYLRKSGL